MSRAQPHAHRAEGRPCHQPSITSVVQRILPAGPWPNDTKPWTQGQPLTLLHKECHPGSRPERPYGSVSCAGLLNGQLEAKAASLMTLHKPQSNEQVLKKRLCSFWQILKKAQIPRKD